MKATAVDGQLTLFEVGPPPVAARTAGLESVTWSYSRRSTLERCALRYYFEYFGASKRTAKSEPAKDELRLLKRLASRHERGGAILHLAIAWYLREAQRGRAPSVERLVGWARHLFDMDRTYSRRDPDGREPDESAKYPPVLLREYHYRQADAEQLCDDAEARLCETLFAFVTDARYGALRLAGTQPGALIEHPFKLVGAQLPCRVDGKLDFACVSGERVTIIDWKLGGADGTGDDSLQLAAYALWAIGHFGCDPSMLRVCKVHLSSGEVVDFRADVAVLTDARARIVQDAVRMAAVQAYGEAAISEAFTPCGQPAICGGCPFQRVCPVGRQFIDA
jgi:hypothetical protein